MIRSGRILTFKSSRRSSFSDFMVVWVFESMHVVGLALLVFVVLPDLDVVKGAMLTNCVAFIPAVLGRFFKMFSGKIIKFARNSSSFQMI